LYLKQALQKTPLKIRLLGQHSKDNTNNAWHSEHTALYLWHKSTPHAVLADPRDHKKLDQSSFSLVNFRRLVGCEISLFKHRSFAKRHLP